MSLKISFLNTLFQSRARRVFMLFLIASVFYLTVSSLFPLWILLIGPVIWGIPHLISSLRYSSLSFDESSRKNMIHFQFYMWIFIFIYRLLNDVLHQPVFLSDYPLLMEAIALIISFLYQVHLFKKINSRILISTLLFALFLSFTYFYPIQTALVLLIGHNYLPLIPWYKSCQDYADLKAFTLSALIYIFFSLLIYFGLLDFIYQIYSPQGNIAFLNWDYSEVIKPFVTDEFDYQFWFHIVVLYAFSQAVHYFIWMKAIPENYQQKQFPPSFKWSFNKLASDFGASSLFLIFSLSLIGVLFWFFFEFQVARIIYFSVASYHGFMEISVLPFLKSNRLQNKQRE